MSRARCEYRDAPCFTWQSLTGPEIPPDSGRFNWPPMRGSLREHHQGGARLTNGYQGGALPGSVLLLFTNSFRLVSARARVMPGILLTSSDR